MKRLITCLMLVALGAAYAGEDLVARLDVAWNRHDYAGCRKLINEALQENPSNLTAQVACAAYHGWVEFDLVAATNAMPRAVMNSPTTGKTASEIVDVWKAALTVPMEKPPTEEQKEFVRRDLWPTNFPERQLLLLLEKEKTELRTTGRTISCEQLPPANDRGIVQRRHQGLPLELHRQIRYRLP